MLASQLTLSDKNINGVISCRERKQDENSKKKWTSMLEKQGKKREVKYRHAQWLLFYLLSEEDTKFLGKIVTR